MSYLANFAANGNPNGSSLPTWQPWSSAPNAPTYINFDATPTDASISMTTGSYTKAGVKTEVETLYPAYAPFIEAFFF